MRERKKVNSQGQDPQQQHASCCGSLCESLQAHARNAWAQGSFSLSISLVLGPALARQRSASAPEPGQSIDRKKKVIGGLAHKVLYAQALMRFSFPISLSGQNVETHAGKVDGKGTPATPCSGTQFLN